MRVLLGGMLLLLATGCQTTNESAEQAVTAQTPATEEEIQTAHDAMNRCMSENLNPIEDGISDADAIASAVISACAESIDNNVSAVARGRPDVHPNTDTVEFRSAFQSFLASTIRKVRASPSYECFRTKDGLCHTRAQFQALTEDAFTCVKRSIPQIDQDVIDSNAVASRIFDICHSDFTPVRGMSETDGQFKNRITRDIADFIQKNRA